MSLTSGRVKELVHLYRYENWELPELAARYEVSVPTVSRVVTGRTWTYVTGGRNVSRAGTVTEYRCAYIQARLDQGCRNLSLIARELGITRQAVSRLVRIRGLGGTNCSAE